MRKTISALGCILFALVALLPFGTLTSAYFGYTFELASISVFAVITAALSVCLTVIKIISKESAENKVVNILYTLLAPISLINSLFYVIESNDILIIICMFICVSCCLILTSEYGKPVILKIISAVLSILMIIPTLYLGFIIFIFGDFAENTVVKTVESTNKVYYAEVTYSDHGALGGSTMVDVYDSKGINAFIFKISRKPQRVYYGEWYEYSKVDIYWKDDNCLVINTVEHRIE